MRSVSSAIWTSVLPVSAALAPNRSTSSRFFSRVRLMRPLRLAARRPLPALLAGLAHVAVHLLDQRLHRVESPLAPQPVEELDPEPVAVEIEVTVQHVGLDQDGSSR